MRLEARNAGSGAAQATHSVRMATAWPRCAPLARVLSQGFRGHPPLWASWLGAPFSRGSLNICPQARGASLTPSLLPLLFGQQLGPSWCSTRLFGIHTAGGIRFSSPKGHTGHILSWLRNCSLLSIEKWKPFILPFKALNLFSASSVVPSFNCWLLLATLY